MILGIGVDIVEIGRMRKAVAKEAFVKRVFTEAEAAYCRSRGDVILSVGDKETNRVGDVRNAVLAAKVGDTVKVKLDRDGSTVTVDVVMEAAS